MNKEWSELNKTMQAQLKKKDQYPDGLDTLFTLRQQLIDVILSFGVDMSRDELDEMPYINADGYHSKNIAYSVWHIFRIEDIVCHTLINDDEQVFFSQGFRARTRSPIITTGNELSGTEISDFTRQLDAGELFGYALQVRESTEDILRNMPYDILKTKIPPERREKLLSLGVVDSSEDASWLVDYWCGKDIRGLIQMPFSRHWIMHIEACLRIRDKLIGKRR